MKLSTILVSIAVYIASLSFSNSVLASDQLAQSLCEYIAADDKSRLRKKLKSSRVKIRNIYDSVLCNGNNLLRHAIASSSAGTGEFIIKNLPKSTLSNGADISWAESNGHSGSPLIAAAKARAGL
jgi:hypothetical protein